LEERSLEGILAILQRAIIIFVNNVNQKMNRRHGQFIFALHELRIDEAASSSTAEIFSAACCLCNHNHQLGSHGKVQ
jgi:hypothetical protein